MRNLALLIRKDFMSVFLRYRYSLLIFLGMLLSFLLFSPTMTAFGFVTINYAMVIPLFSNEENDLICNVAGILPVRRKQIAVARYLYTYLILILEIVLGQVVGNLANIIRGQQDFMTPMLTGIIMSLLMICVSLPLLYHLGAARARIFVAILYAFAILAATIISASLQVGLLDLSHQTFLLAGISSALLLLVSMRISLHIRR